MYRWFQFICVMGDNFCSNLFANHWQLSKSTVRPWLGPFVMEGARKVFICLPAPANLTNICLNRKLANLLLRWRRFNCHCKAFPLTWQGDVWFWPCICFSFPWHSDHACSCFPCHSLAAWYILLTWYRQVSNTCNIKKNIDALGWEFSYFEQKANHWKIWMDASHTVGVMTSSRPATSTFSHFISWAWLKSIIERREGHISWLPRRINFFLLGEFLWSWNL